MIKELADFLDLEWFSDFNMPEFVYNLIPYNKVIYDNDFGYCIQYKNPSNHLTPINKMSEEDQLRLLNHLRTPTLKNCLLQLDRAGWSTLIDSRWEEEKKATVSVIKKVLICFVLSCIFSIFVPSSDQLVKIYGIGGTIDYIKSNETAKQLPDKCIKALDLYIDSQLKESK